jgi:hypothetical protein
MYLKMKVLKVDPATIAAVATKRTSQAQDTNGATPPAHKREPDALTKEATEADDPDIQHCVYEINPLTRAARRSAQGVEWKRIVGAFLQRLPSQ